MDPHLVNPFHHVVAITEIASFSHSDPSLNPGLDPAVMEVGQPSVEEFGGKNPVHVLKCNPWVTQCEPWITILGK